MTHPLSKHKTARNASIIRLFGELWVETDGIKPTIQQCIAKIEKKLPASASTIRGILRQANLIGKGTSV